MELSFVLGKCTFTSMFILCRLCLILFWFCKLLSCSLLLVYSPFLNSSFILLWERVLSMVEIFWSSLRFSSSMLLLLDFSEMREIREELLDRLSAKNLFLTSGRDLFLLLYSLARLSWRILLLRSILFCLSWAWKLWALFQCFLNELIFAICSWHTFLISAAVFFFFADTSFSRCLMKLCSSWKMFISLVVLLVHSDIQ